MKKIFAFVEKIEENIVRLDAVKPAKGTFFIPKDNFPFPVKEGMWLKISFQVDESARKNAVKRIVELQNILQQKNKNE